MFTRKTFQNRYEGKMKAFKICGNVYFVDCFPASSHLIDTGNGLILIDTGYADTLAKGAFDYDNCRADYRNSLNRLSEKLVDVFIGNHVWNNDTEPKGELLLKTGENKFIDNKIWHEFLDFCEKRLDDVIKKEAETK